MARKKGSRAKTPKKKGSKASEANLEEGIEATPATTGTDPHPKLQDPSLPSPLYFWKEADPKTGYLSQWHHCPFTDNDGKTYKTAEQ